VRASWRIARGGVSPSSEAEYRPRGTAAGRLVGRCGFFGSWAFPLWAAATWSVFFRVRGMLICVLLFFEKGFFPGY
jgi:hypothetical protein